MAQANAAPPEMIPVTAVTNIMRRPGRHFAGMRHAKLPDEGDEQIDDKRHYEGC